MWIFSLEDSFCNLNRAIVISTRHSKDAGHCRIRYQNANTNVAESRLKCKEEKRNNKKCSCRAKALQILHRIQINICLSEIQNTHCREVIQIYSVWHWTGRRIDLCRFRQWSCTKCHKVRQIAMEIHGWWNVNVRLSHAAKWTYCGVLTYVEWRIVR